MSGGRNGARLLVQNLAALHADVIHFMSGRNSIVTASGQAARRG